MRKQNRQHYKHIIVIFMLMLFILNIGISLAYWATAVNGNQTSANSLLPIGEWDFEDTSLVVATFRFDHAYALSLTEDTVTANDKISIEAALAEYGLLSADAQAMLTSEETLLLNLYTAIIALEHSEFLDFENEEYDSGLTGTVDINDRTWYGNGVYISNDDQYDVWNDTRALSMDYDAYFESQDVFLNGIDKITLYHGALYYGNGTSFQFKIEYELDSNPGVWLTLQENGSDLLIDIESSTPLTYTEIDVNIDEAVNIRFTPVISSNSYYLCLDDIRIYEHVVSSDLEASTFSAIYAGALSLTTDSVSISDKDMVEEALDAYDLLSVEAQSLLTTEKALLDDLLIEITNLENIQYAQLAVITAESSYLQADVDAAQLLITALPESEDKMSLQDRLNIVQDTIDSVIQFELTHANALSLTVSTVSTSDQTIVEDALTAYALLSDEAQSLLITEKALLDDLLVEIHAQIPTETQVAQFRSEHAYVLSLTTETVTINDLANVELALMVYETLSNDAKAQLTTEKALIDDLLTEINRIEAQTYVEIAESTNEQADLDTAQTYVDALPNGIDKTALQDRIDAVQHIIDIAIIAETYRNDHVDVLSLTEETVTTNDKASIETAFADFGMLSADAQTALALEETLLLNLYTAIIAFEHSEFLDFDDYISDVAVSSTIEINGRTYNGENAFIANNINYDVWNDGRSLALKKSSYFESQDVFLNGIDKITLYHGALEYGNGTSFQFKIEYELDSNPGVWLTLQENGSDLLIDIESSTPLTYTEINVNIDEAVNIRFTPIISDDSEYINLDDIRIYEHVVSSDLEATTYELIYADALSLTTDLVKVSDKEMVEGALDAYDLLSFEAQTLLTTEKALLDDLLIAITNLENIQYAQLAVITAESSYLQVDVDVAQTLITALPTSATKTSLQERINAVQAVIDRVVSFEMTHASALLLTVTTVSTSDRTIVEDALTAYALLSDEAQALLSTEKALLDDLLVEINAQTPTETQVSTFRSDHAYVLSLTTETITMNDLANVELALIVYETLSNDAKAQLTAEKALLDDLLTEINRIEAQTYVEVAESTLLQADLDTAQAYVNALPDSADKTALQNRIDALQSTIDSLAANAVDELITTIPVSGEILLSHQADIEAARLAYNALTATQKALVTAYDQLVAAEAEILQLQYATTAVETAESSMLQVDLNSALVLVNALANGTAKTNLEDRLDVVQTILDVDTAIALILSYFDNNDVEVTRFNSTIKENAFLSDANDVVDGLNVTISITNTNETDRRNTTYTIEIAKNGYSSSIDIDVTFTRN